MPVSEQLGREHEVLCRAIRGGLDVPLGTGASLDQVFPRGERALEDERRATARRLTAEARRLQDLGRAPAEKQSACTLEEFLAAFGIKPS